MLGLAIIAGRVLDERGRPVADAIVGASGPLDRSLGRTNRQGRFRLGIVTEHPVRILARKPGFLFAALHRVDPDSPDVELVLHRGAGLAGRVVADPLPVRFRVRLFHWHGGRGRRVPGGCVLRRPGGRFSVSRVPAGLYEVVAEAEGYVCPGGAIVRVDPGETVGGLELALVPA